MNKLHTRAACFVLYQENTMSADFDYRRVKTTKLYETQVPGSVGWAAYVLPELPSGVRDFPASITTVLSLLLYQGHYCFSTEKPPAATADPDGFVKQVMDYVADIVKNGNRGLFWLKGYSPVQFGKLANFGFEFSTDGNNFIVHSDFTARLGKAVEFFANAGKASGPGANPLVLSGNQPGELRLNPLTQPGLLGFRKGSADLGITVGDASSQIVRIPLGGSNAACMVFNGTSNTSITFSGAGLALGFEYTYGSVEQPEHLFYPGFDVAAFPAALSCTGSIDPSDPVNTRISETDLASGYLRTGFGIASTPSLSSSFRTAQGR